MTQQMAAWGPNPSGRGFLAPNPASLLLAVLYCNTHSSKLLGSEPGSRRRGPDDSSDRPLYGGGSDRDGE
jgi:hypothetical protein